jgi:hypothetical protein
MRQSAILTPEAISIRLTLHHWSRKVLHRRHLLAFLACPMGANQLHKPLATDLASIGTIPCPLIKALLVLISWDQTINHGTLNKAWAQSIAVNPVLRVVNRDLSGDAEYCHVSPARSRAHLPVQSVPTFELC